MKEKGVATARISRKDDVNSFFFKFCAGLKVAQCLLNAFLTSPFFLRLIRFGLLIWAFLFFAL